MSIDQSPRRAAVRRGHRRGVAAVEFALVAPLLVTLALGTYDLVAGTTAWWHLALAARAVGEIATASAANPDQSNSLTAAEAYAASTAIYPLMPQLRSAAAQDFGVVLSSVVFTPTVSGCTSGCKYNAAVAWSHTLVGGAAARVCGALASALDAAAPAAGTLPADAFSAAPILLIDVIYQFRPVFTSFVLGAIPMQRTAYLPLRTGTNAAWVRYIDANDPNAMCNGYS
jgi:Flp pilus assembly protein TadG